jgi:adenylylsulfate reductase subunit B
MPPIINNKKCIACGICANVCPQDVYFGSKKKEIPVVSYPEECWHCTACVIDCPAEGAISLRIPMPMSICFK